MPAATPRRQLRIQAENIFAVGVGMWTVLSMGGYSWAGLDGSHELAGGGESAQPAPSEADAGPAAIVGERAVSFEELRAGLLEAAGAQVLSEAVLDDQLARRLRAAGMSVGEEEVRRERDLVLEALGLAGLSPDEAQRAVDQERAARGLGPTRFAALLKRNAMLRALVSPGITVGEDLVRQAYAVRHGEKVVLRILVTADVESAARVRAELDSARVEGESDARRELRFAEKALKESTDTTAALGGLVEPLSVEDTRYPDVIRQAARSLKPGEMSPALAMETRGVIVYLRERRAPAPDAPTLEAERQALTAQLRVGMERRAMEELANQVQREARVLVMDRALGWSWERRRRP